jgi:hypothetical protein
LTAIYAGNVTLNLVATALQRELLVRQALE